MKSQFVNGTINKDIYVHQDADTVRRVDELEEEIVLKQDKLTAGENITISEDNVISANAQPGIFEVVYGETPFEDIFNAYHSGNIPVCTVNAETYYVSMMYGSSAQTGYAVFTNSQGQHTSDFSVVYPSTYSQIRTGYLESTENLVQTISADSTTSQYPSAKAVWNQAVKYTKVKRFIGHIQGNQEGNPLILDSNNLADIYNAQTSGNQIVFIFDDTNKLTYRVNYCFIDNTYPEAQKIVVYATAEHADTEQSPTFGVSERYFDTLYAKSAAQSPLLYPYTRRLQDKLTAGENITINNNVISATGGIDPEQLVTVVTAESTDEQIPTAKAVYDAIIENSSDSIYETTVYYNDTATFDEYGETSLGACDIPLDTPELKVTIDGTEYTLHRFDDGGGIWWSNDDESIGIWKENGDFYLASTSTSSQDCVVKVEGRVLAQDFINAVNDAVTYYDVYLDNQLITFNEQGVAELGKFNLNPEQTPKLLMTIDGEHEFVYTWNGEEEAYINEESGTIIGEEDGTWFLASQGASGSIPISLSSADVKSDFKDAVLSVAGDSQVEIFDVTYQYPKGDIQGLYILMDSKTIEDICNAYGGGKTVLIRYNRQNDANDKLAVSNTVVVWTVESIYTDSNHSYTIITNAVKFIDDEGNECYVRLKCDGAYSDTNRFTGYPEESGGSNVSFVLTSSAPKGQIDGEPTSWYLTDNKTFEDVYNAFINDKTVYLITTYNQIYNTYQVTSALHDGGSSKGPYDSYTIYAESFAGIDANGNVQMKYLQVEQGYDGHGTPFTLYNKTISDVGQTISTETWTFTLQDGTTFDKQVIVPYQMTEV